MNKMTLMDIREISDSREVLTERPHRFVPIFAYILIALILVALIWSFFGEIDIYVRAAGEVRPNESISVIRNTFSGRVLVSNLEEGMVVNRGDMLFELDMQNQQAAMEIVQRQYDTVSLEIRNHNLLRESLLTGENLFDPNCETQIDYYFRFRRHVTEVAFAIEQIRNTNLDFTHLHSEAQITRDAATTNNNRLATELRDLRSLLSSIENGRSTTLPNGSEQYHRFVEFELSIARFDNLIYQRESSVNMITLLYESDSLQLDNLLYQSKAVLYRLNALYEVGGVSRNEREAAQHEHESMLLERKRLSEILQNELNSAAEQLSALELERESFINETSLSVLQNITHIENRMTDLDLTIRNAQSVIYMSYDRGFSEELIEQRHQLELLTSISDSLFTLQNSRNTLAMELNTLQMQILEAQILAPIDGVVSMFTQINTGDFIQAGMEIATIIPATYGDTRVVLAVSNADIADIEVGQKIYLRFAALPFTEFGEMPGHVTRISADARSGADGESIFLVEAEMYGDYLTDRNGYSAQVRVGMIADARVVTRSQRIIYWVLERLNFVEMIRG